MQQLVNVNDIFQSISALSFEKQFFIADTLNKRIRDLKREKLFLRAKEAETEYKLGQVKSGTVDNFIKDIK